MPLLTAFAALPDMTDNAGVMCEGYTQDMQELVVVHAHRCTEAACAVAKTLCGVLRVMWKWRLQVEWVEGARQSGAYPGKGSLLLSLAGCLSLQLGHNSSSPCQ